MKSQKICFSQLWKICSKRSLESLCFPFLCILTRQMSPSPNEPDPSILWSLCFCWQSPRMASLFFWFLYSEKILKIFLGGENSLQPNLQLSTLIFPACHHGKKYSGGLDGFYTSHISRAWGSAPQPSMANQPHIARGLVLLSTRSTKITHGHRNKCTSQPPKCTQMPSQWCLAD